MSNINYKEDSSVLTETHLDTRFYTNDNEDYYDDSYFNKEKRVRMLKAWSFSRLTLYEGCPHKAKLQYIDKIEELPRELQPGQTEFANDRGSRVHAAAETYVKGETDELAAELLHFKPELETLRGLYPDAVTPEEMWCFTEDWATCNHDDYDNIWLRVIADAFVWLSDTEVTIVDYKTGKRYGNELKHGQQMTLYALATAMKYPQVETIHTELWYLDLNELASQTYRAHQALAFAKNFNDRALRLTSDTEFKPKPSKSSCMFCPYGKKEHSNKWVKKTGDCEHSVG